MEKFYQYLWKWRLFGLPLADVDGGEVEVLDPGLQNNDAGPDFFNAKVRMKGTEWAGNVEIHVKASDWYRHGHQDDPAYGSVVLHAVGVSDRRVKRPDGSQVPQAVMTMPEGFFETFARLSEDRPEVRCAPLVGGLTPLAVADWLESLAVERLQEKALKAVGIYRNCACDWQQTCFVMMARALGFGLNGDPFEMLARSLPLRVLHRHSDNLFQLEALLFGQAGMLDATDHILDEYYQHLCREYYFLARKYGLRPMRGSVWKYARTRPSNFPHRRIVFLARACLGGFGLFSKLLEAAPDRERLGALFRWRAEGYWQTHSDFGLETHGVPDRLSDQSIDLLLINAVAPLLYAYASVTGDCEAAEKATSLLEGLPAERNAIVKGWNALGFRAADASRSQALIQLKKQYCDARNCLRCRFGHLLLGQSANPALHKRPAIVMNKREI